MNDFLIFLYILITSTVFAFLAYKFLPPGQISVRQKKIVPRTIIIFFFVYYTSIICLNYRFFLTGGDLPIFTEVFKSTLQGKFMLSTVERGSYNFLGHHFSPILIIMVPLYFLWQHPLTLIVIQMVVFMAGAWTLYRLTDYLLEHTFLAAAVTIGYLLAPLQLEDFITGFHMDYFTPAFIVMALYSLFRKKYWLYFLFIFLLLITKLDTFIYAASIGLYALFFRKERKVGIFTVLLVLAYTGICHGMIRPMIMDTASSHHNWISKRYSYLGGDFKSALVTTFFRPLVIVKHFFEYHLSLKLKSLCFILIPVAGLPLVSGGALVMLLPAAAVMLLSSHWSQNSLVYHYAVTIYIFTFVATVIACYRVFKNRSFRWLNAVAAFILVAGVLVHYNFSRWTPAKQFDFSAYTNSVKVATAYRIFKLLPPGSSVTARTGYAAHLLKSHPVETIKYHGKIIPTNTEYILIDDEDRHSEYFFDILYQRKYGVVYYDDCFVLLKKGSHIENNAKAFQDIFSVIEGEHKITKMGEVVNDPDAINTQALLGEEHKDKCAVMAYGPYSKYPQGKYEIRYYLKIADNGIIVPVAKIDITTDGAGTVLAEKEIKGTDFAAADSYQYFALYYDHTNAQAELEFRVHFLDKTDLWLDRVEIYSPAFDLDEFWELNSKE